MRYGLLSVGREVAPLCGLGSACGEGVSRGRCCGLLAIDVLIWNGFDPERQARSEWPSVSPCYSICVEGEASRDPAGRSDDGSRGAQSVQCGAVRPRRSGAGRAAASGFSSISVPPAARSCAMSDARYQPRPADVELGPTTGNRVQWCSSIAMCPHGHQAIPRDLESTHSSEDVKRSREARIQRFASLRAAGTGEPRPEAEGADSVRLLRPSDVNCSDFYPRLKPCSRLAVGRALPRRGDREFACGRACGRGWSGRCWLGRSRSTSTHYGAGEPVS
jgi:hypothetical protein